MKIFKEFNQHIFNKINIIKIKMPQLFILSCNMFFFTLKEHITKTPALLLCISGFVMYEDENDTEITLEPGDYVMITPEVKHWLFASVKSQLVLLK